MKIKTLGMTRKRFTVVLGCCDPPSPVYITSTNSPVRARAIFEALKANEIKEGGGGEFDLTLYKHTPESRPKVFRTDEGHHDGVFIHSVIYEGSEVVDSFTYMDMMGANDDEEEREEAGGEGGAPPPAYVDAERSPQDSVRQDERSVSPH